MRLALALPVAALALAAALPAPAHAQLYATGISASFPDPNGKVPAFNAVPGAGIQTWSIGYAQAVLVHGHAYNYCVSLGSGTATGKANIAYKITRGKTVIQTHSILKQLTIGSNGIWYECSGYTVVPNSPGPATLTGTTAYFATGSTKPVTSKVSSSVLIQ
jgi:hypothetical protein